MWKIPVQSTLVIWSVRKLQDIIWESVHGPFTPDASRPGYFAEPCELQPAQNSTGVKDEIERKEVPPACALPHPTKSGLLLKVPAEKILHLIQVVAHQANLITDRWKDP